MCKFSQFIYSISELLGSLIELSVTSDARKDWAANLGLEDENGWHNLQSSCDLLEDTTSAIDNFLKFGLDGPTKCGERGESYLRLYGVLNAIYIQQQTTGRIWSLANQKPNDNEIDERLKALPIRRIRREIGAHSINIRDRSESYAPIYPLSELHFKYVDNSQKNWDAKSFNFSDGIHEHYQLVATLLFEAMQELLKRARFESDTQSQDFKARLEESRLIKEGRCQLELSCSTSKVILKSGPRPKRIGSG